MVDETREEWPQGCQDGRVYPLGRALRLTYGADNHDSLDHEVTGLMIDLSKIPYEEAAARVEPHPAESDVQPSILSRLIDLIGHR